jgi:hypothetical protein
MNTKWETKETREMNGQKYRVIELTTSAIDADIYPHQLLHTVLEHPIICIPQKTHGLIVVTS